MREVLDKSNVMIWLKIPLFAGGTFFGLLAVDKNRLDGDFTIIECERMVAICRSAAQALYRISLTGIQKVMRDFRHVLAQQLGAINHYIRAFAHQDIPKAKRQEYSERVNNIIERLGNFSKNMAWTLPVTGTVPLQIEAISISDIVDDIYGLFTYYGRSLNIELLSENLGYTVRTDEMMLRLILYNLIDNAFTSLSKVEGDRKLTVECQVSDGSLVLYVIDNGPGINPQIWDSIYDLGFSTSKGHTGIGLTSSLELAKRLNVVLDHDRDFFPGARFYVKFPPSAIVEVKKDEIHPIS
jgi:signal transduction histidine kinase